MQLHMVPLLVLLHLLSQLRLSEITKAFWLPLGSSTARARRGCPVPTGAALGALLLLRKAFATPITCSMTHTIGIPLVN